MGLKTLAQTLGQKAIALVGDLASDVVYHRITGEAYNPVTDTNTETSTTINVKGVLVRGKEDEDDSNTPDDISTKVIISALDLGVVPASHDKMVINAATWEIVKMVYDPARAVYIFTIRVP